MVKIVDYDVTVNDAEADVTVDVESGNIVAKVTNVPDVSYSLKASGNWAEKIVSKVLEPIANLVAKDFKSKPRDELQGQSKTIGNKFSFQYEGVTVELSDPTLGSFTDPQGEKLKITGDINISQ